MRLVVSSKEYDNPTTTANPNVKAIDSKCILRSSSSRLLTNFLFAMIIKIPLAKFTEIAKAVKTALSSQMYLGPKEAIAIVATQLHVHTASW